VNFKRVAVDDRRLIETVPAWDELANTSARAAKNIGPSLDHLDRGAGAAHQLAF
jgi:hypothetical protein